MVFLPSVNVAIRVNSLYRTATRHIQMFVFWIGERGNWLFVRLADVWELGFGSTEDPGSGHANAKKANQQHGSEKSESQERVSLRSSEACLRRDNPSALVTAERSRQANRDEGRNLCVTLQVFDCRPSRSNSQPVLPGKSVASRRRTYQACRIRQTRASGSFAPPGPEFPTFDPVSIDMTE